MSAVIGARISARILGSHVPRPEKNGLDAMNSAGGLVNQRAYWTFSSLFASCPVSFARISIVTSETGL
jgi:hypothetical protein